MLALLMFWVVDYVELSTLSLRNCYTH